MAALMTEFEEFLARVTSAQRVLIGTHLNPDGDALGSALALSHYLREQGISTEVLCNNPAPRNLRFLPGVDDVRFAPKESDHDLAVVVDLDSLDRLGRVRPYFEEHEHLVVIDHHQPHESPGFLRLVDVRAPATAVILTRIFRSASHPISPAVATCLLTGITTDTGSFRFQNTTPESLHLAAELIALGGDVVTIGEEVYQRKALPSVRLLGRAIEVMRLEENGGLGWATLSLDDFALTGATEEHTEGIVNEVLAVETVEIAALIREPSPGRVRASLRSRGAYDVAAVAREFGGGGHRAAAGCTFDTPLAEAEKLLVEAMRRCLASSSSTSPRE